MITPQELKYADEYTSVEVRKLIAEFHTEYMKSGDPHASKKLVTKWVAWAAGKGNLIGVKQMEVMERKFGKEKT